MNNLKLKVNIANKKGTVCDLLSEASGLSKSRIKQAMIKGAVWLRSGKAKQRRIRRATRQIQPTDQLALYYDEGILALKTPGAICIEDFTDYSIWYKPAGLMTQGTLYGDHCALSRHAENYFQPHRNVFIVHRIDRETAGLVLLCHNKKAAALFSRMFQKRKIEKGYDVRVRGKLGHNGKDGEIDLPLDGKAAVTRYRCMAHDPDIDESRAHVEIITGRMHQIRRHFDMIGHPVVGDPRYGDNNKNRTGLKLIAKSLAFTCPFTQRPVSISIDPEDLPEPYRGGSRF